MSQQERDTHAEHEPDLWPSPPEGGEPMPRAPSVVGATLRATRQRYGWDLNEVERALRIRMAHLQAIEDGRFEDLPGPAYAIGFVRAYAEHLGLEHDEVVGNFRQEIANLPRRTELNFPTPIPESRVPSGAILLISLAVAVAAYGGWYFLTMNNRDTIASVGEIPQKFTDMIRGREEQQTPATEAVAAPAPTNEISSEAAVPASGPAADGAADEQTAATGATPGTAETTDSGDAGSASLKEQFGALPTIAPEAGSPPDAQVFGEANTNARIVIRANADSWVQVRDANGDLVWTRMLRPGDSYRVPNKDGMTLLTGNAGALEIYVDGRKAPSLGPSGAIRRDVELSADRLLAGASAEN
jgi:cytoskeleton protein RodZ